MMPTLHLIHGFTGSGKTTFSKNLETEIKAVRLSPDEWMRALYGENPDGAIFADLAGRVTGVMWEQACRILAAGTDVILDYGFWKRADRDDYKKRAADIGVAVKLYALACDFDAMKARVLKRTAEMPEGQLYIDENAINEFWARFEPVDPEAEGAIVIQS